MDINEIRREYLCKRRTGLRRDFFLITPAILVLNAFFAVLSWGNNRIGGLLNTWVVILMCWSLTGTWQKLKEVSAQLKELEKAPN